MTTSEARIEAIVAREANVAVVFRRGPKRRTQMLLWDLNRDEITPGQWIGGRVNVRDCDVTPDARLLVAGISNPGNRRAANAGVEPRFQEGWTAISRPPYFTALALWFDGLGLGGFWSSARELHLYRTFAKESPHRGYVDETIRRLTIGRSVGALPDVFTGRLRRDGWTKPGPARRLRLTETWRENSELRRELVSAGIDLSALEALRPHDFPYHIQIETTEWERRFAAGRLVRSGVGESTEALALEDLHGTVRWERAHPRNFWNWIDLDAHERVIFADRGCLWRWNEFPDGEPTLVADLNANVFTPVETPAWAREWPSDAIPEW